MARVWSVIGLAVLVAACSAEAPEPAAPMSVLVRTVGDGAGEQLRVFTGEIAPRHASDLGFRVSGKLVERRVEVGDAVKRGQVLARLDGADLHLNVTAARAQVAAAKSDLALAQSELVRARALRKQNFVSDAALDSQRTGAEAAQARLRQARAQLDLAENRKEYTTLSADADGVVTAVMADVGQVLETGSPVVSLAREGGREVHINVPEGLRDAVAPGTPAKITLWSEKDELFAGVVREVAPSADRATRTYTVKVTVDAAAERLPLGATATVVFDGGRLAGVRVPLRAVGDRDGKPVVWVFDPAASTVDPVPVTVARFDEAGAVLDEGIAPGMQVVVAGVHLLHPGQQVRAVPDSAPVLLDASR